MRTASELYEFSKSQTPILVTEILKGVREHIIESCERDAAQGSTYYNIYLKKGRAFIKEALLDECIKMVKEFEEKGYKISIDDSGNGYYIDFIITTSWDGVVKKHSSYKSLSTCKHLYDTENGRCKVTDKYL
jgi:predicted hydrocarbon binding protein